MEVKNRIRKIIQDEGWLFGENSNLVLKELVDYLAPRAEEDVETLLQCIRDVMEGSEIYLENYLGGEEDVLVDIREKSHDEKKLKFSGINQIKKNILHCIRKEMEKGNNHCRCYGYLYERIYDRDNYIIGWLENLGFDAEISRTDGYSGIIVSWKEKNLSQS